MKNIIYHDIIYGVINWCEATVYLLTLTMYHPNWCIKYLGWRTMQKIKGKYHE